jgi:hypothetical protein
MEAGMMPFEACMRDDKMYAIPGRHLPMNRLT